MPSKRQIEANRDNAKRSTGPKTKAGKTRSARNALRHGLSRPAKDDVALERLADAINAGLDGKLKSSTTTDLARANLRLSHIRRHRYAMLASWLECPDLKQLKRIASLERYERLARAAHHRALKALMHDR
jgi:hypothetical protein